VGFILFVLVLRKNNRPLATIIELLRKKDASIKSVNEFEIIHQYIDQISNQSNETKEILRNHQKLLSDSFLFRLLREKIQDDMTAFSLAQSYDVFFDYLYFNAAVLRLDQACYEKERIAVYHLLWHEAMSFNEAHNELTIILSEIDTNFVFLFNFDSDNQHHLMKNFLNETVRLLQQQLIMNFKIGIGQAYDRISQISVSYNESTWTIDNCGDGLHYFIDTNINNGHNYYIDKFYDFDQAMARSEYRKAKEIIMNIIDEEIPEEDNLVLNFNKNIMLNKIITNIESILYKFGNQTNKIDNLRHIYKKNKLLENWLTAAFDHLIESKQENSKITISYAEKAKQIIDIDYGNQLLGLYSISEQLLVSNTYLSTTFKKTYGVGLTDYINFIRIEKSKELIKQGRKKIKEVAIEVGFASDINFIRVFKKYEHVSPGKFKLNSD
jgi:YesN/AraC family two-component response regulator